MKFSIKHKLIVLLSIILSTLQLSAQNHKSNFSLKNEILPTNRTAFLYCYNNQKTAENSAITGLNNLKQFKCKSFSESKIVETPVENICIFPNITDDELWVEIKNKTTTTDDLNIEIYNSTGKRVYLSRIEKNLHKINVCDFTAGTFLVKLGDRVQKIEIE